MGISAQREQRGIEMPITLSFLWTICILGWGYARTKSLKELFCFQLTFLLVLDLGCITSTAAVVGGQEVNCSDLVLAALTVTSIFLLAKHVKVDKKLVVAVACLCGALIVCLLANVLFPFEGVTIGASGSWDRFYYGLEAMTPVGMGMRTLLVMIRLALWLLVMCAASAVLQKQDHVASACAVITFGKIQLAWGLVEFITKNIFGTTIMTDIAQLVFPSNGSVYLTLNVRGDFASIQGFTREPSHFAMAVFFFVLIELLLSRCISRREKKDVPWIILAVALMALSGAFTAVVGLVILGSLALYFYFESHSGLPDKANRVDVRIVFVLVLIAFVAAALVPVILDAFGESYYVKKFENVVNNMGALLSRNYSYLSGTSDALPRVISIVESLFIFFARPLFGIGPGVVNPFSGVVATLADYGIVFTLLWYVVVGVYARRTSGRVGARLFVVLLVAVGLLLFDGDYIYNSCWLLLAGLFGIAANAKKTEPSACMTAKRRSL